MNPSWNEDFKIKVLTNIVSVSLKVCVIPLKNCLIHKKVKESILKCFRKMVSKFFKKFHVYCFNRLKTRSALLFFFFTLSEINQLNQGFDILKLTIHILYKYLFL